MKYIKVVWGFILRNIYAFTIGAAILLATLAPLEARLEVQAFTFNTYLCSALLLGGVLGFKSKNWIAAKMEYGKLFLGITGLNMVVAKMCNADPKQTMYLILMMHIFVGGSFFLSHLAATTPNPFKAGDVIVTRWSVMGGFTYMLVGSCLIFTLPQYSTQIADVILVSIR